MKRRRLFKRNIFRRGINNFRKELISGEYGFMLLQNHLLNKKNVEAGRVIVRRELKKKSKLYVRPRFLTPITKKPSGVRMGKGKGPVHDLVCFAKMDTCLYEVKGLQLKKALKILKKLSYKYRVPLALVDTSGTRYYVKNK